MKYSYVATLAIAGMVSAQSPAAQAVNTVLGDITTSLNSFGKAIEGYQPGQEAALTSASQSVESAVKSGATKVAAGGQLSLTDSVAITGAVTTLQSTLDSTLSTLQGKAKAFAAAKQCSAVAEQLGSQITAATSLKDAIASKAPPEAKAIAEQLGGQVSASLEDAKSKWSTACPADGGSAPSGGSSTPSTPAPASPAAPAGSDHSGHSDMPAAPATTTGASSPTTFTGAASGYSVSMYGIAAALAVFAL